MVYNPTYIFPYPDTATTDIISISAPTTSSSIGKSSISQLDIKGTTFDFDLSEDKKEALLQELLKRCTARPTVEHKCHNCGAVLEIDENKHIFHCSYCGSAYAIGTSLINDRG